MHQLEVDLKRLMNRKINQNQNQKLNKLNMKDKLDHPEDKLR